MCQGVSGSIDSAVQISYQSANYSSKTTSSSSSDPNARYHDFRWATGENNYRPTWFTEQMLFMESGYYKGNMGFPPSYLKTLASTDNYIGYINGRVYDLTSYVRGVAPPQYPPGQNESASLPDSSFMDQSLVGLFTDSSGEDLTQQWLKLDMDEDLRDRMQLCLDNLYFVGRLDTRNSAKCQFAQYFSLAISILLVSVIGFKFLAALQFGGNSLPENLDRFVMITIPAYTEGLSLARAIDSAAKMQYDDKRKLLVIICDGMVMGQGEEKPTPRIVLDYLGVPADVDPEPLSFESLGEGQKQHNMGKVYSGLHEVAGHVVPFLVVVKIGKPSEVSRPGNRGKRDSQMVMMRFLNRIHYNLPMSPLELEMHHQIRNIIGVNPAFYEYLLQIDADTVVAPDSATRFVAAFLHDTRLLGVCGETALSNAKHSVVTMIQVYEYFISVRIM
jgi:chitin synthase